MNSIHKDKILNIPSISLKYGLAAGLSMGLALLMLQLFCFEYAPYLKLTKYLFLIIFIAAMLSFLRKRFEDNFFTNGLVSGLRTAFTAGLTLAIMNILIYALAPEFAFTKYTLIPDRVFEAIAVSGILFFETFVFGGIITFFFLQMFKSSGPQLSETID